MSEREQWWRVCQKCDGRGRTFDDDGEWTCDCQDKSPGYVVPAHPAAGSWRTDIENAPRNEVVLILHQTGIYSIGVANPYDYIREYPPAYWAPIYPPKEAPNA